MRVLNLMQLDPEDYKAICDLGFYLRFAWKANGDRDAVIVDTDAGPRRLHRFLLGVTDSAVYVDHINGDPFDNRRCNLRLCNNMQNQMNARPHVDKTTKLPKGVTYAKDNSINPYRVRVSVLGTRITIGSFATVERAEQAYLLTVEALHNKFAYHLSRSKK